MEIKNRIKEFRMVKASELVPNEKNWRTHPGIQSDAVRDILLEIGWAGAALAYHTADGLKLIDGHLGAETAGNADIPVLILDVSESEANKLLAVLDPLGTLAEANAEKFQQAIEGFRERRGKSRFIIYAATFVESLQYRLRRGSL